MSSFNYPATTDQSLLTPVSSAGSPPLQERQEAKMRNYQSQTAVPGAQVPTPPNTSKLYYHSYDVNASSQSSSPMTVHQQVTEAPSYAMEPYLTHSPPSGLHPSSPKAEIPPPIDPYLGHFSVSGVNDSEVSHHPFTDYQHFSGVEVDPTAGYSFRQQGPHVPVSTAPMHHRLPTSGSQTPVLGQPHHAQFRQHTPRVPGIEDLRDPNMFLGTYPSHATLSPGRRVQPRKKPTSARKSARTPKTSPHPGASEGQGNTEDDDKDELTLREDAPDDDKYLFQLRKEFIAEKGKGMWEEMKAKYSEKHQGNWEKAALQMKVSRAVAKYGVWPKREVCCVSPYSRAKLLICPIQIERLKEAHRYYEEKRYQLILTRMKENGGCKVWDWKPQHVEAMLVKLGMEEPTIDEKSGSRRRKNKAARRRNNSQTGHHHIMNDWSNGLGLHPGYQGHPSSHHMGPAGMRAQPYEVMSDEASIAPTFSSEQENEYLDQIFNKTTKVEGSLSPEMMEMGYDEEAAGRSRAPELHHHQSERVARQACEQLMQQQHPRMHEHNFAAAQ